MPSERELEGQVALVTGGGRGIGANIARELAAAGSRVAVTGRTLKQIEVVAREIHGLPVQGDVSRREDVERWVREVQVTLGPIDLLVNNAGIAGESGPAWETDPREWWRVFEVNVLGAFLCCHAVLPGMIERGRGRIVNVSSGAAYLPGSGMGSNTSYGPSKAALYRFSELLAGQVGEHGVSVFPISPGLVKTDMARALWENFGDALAKRLAMRRLGEPDDIAGAAVFLASDAAAWITGHVLVVDGGALLGSASGSDL